MASLKCQLHLLNNKSVKTGATKNGAAEDISVARSAALKLTIHALCHATKSCPVERTGK